MKMHRVYDNEFYNGQKNYSLNSAKVIVPFILETFPVTSVVDIGCGVGTWLSVFLHNGIREIKGFDVNNLPEESYFIAKDKIMTDCDFSSEDFETNCSASLAICLEVAEHLTDTVSNNLIKILVKTAPVVIFSAAFPGQTGVNHINEQPPWYWREIFHSYGYVEIDFLRPLIWSDERVAWWYRQNITSFVNSDYIKTQMGVKLLARYKEQPDPQRLTVVSESLLKNVFSEMQQKKCPLNKLRFFLKGFL